MRGRSLTRAITWPVIAASAGVLVSSPADATSEQGLFLDLTNALQRVSEMSSRWSVLAPPSETFTHDFTLVGVVIGGNTRLALIQRATGSELFPVGGAVGGYRLIDVEENQATLEGQRGERIVLRLPTGGGAAAVVAQPASGAESPVPAASSAASLPELIKAKEAGAASRAERKAQEKARALRERGASPGPQE